jgi:hypothetical protein
MAANSFPINSKITPELDPEFRPAILEHQSYLTAVRRSGNSVPVRIALERNDHQISTVEIPVFKNDREMLNGGFFYVERFVKTLLWQKGGWKFTFGGPPSIGQYFKYVYAPGGLREFDAQFMGRLYKRPFSIDITELEKVPKSQETSQSIGRHLNGCGIALDLGSSDCRVSAVVNGKGFITGWLNELAFMPVDYNTGAPVDEWSGDYGCGVKYFSQDAVLRLAAKAGITFNRSMSPVEKLKMVQNLLATDDSRSRKIFETIGVYLGYSLAYYAMLYKAKRVLIFGNVTSGEGGAIILAMTDKVLATEFPDIHRRLDLHLPGESGRRLGQAVVVASLPELHA